MTYEETAIWIVALAPPGIVLLEGFWDFHIRPHLIPMRRIAAMTDLMLATFGPYAEHEAFPRQQDAWYRGDRLAQGVWMRIRRRLRRRWARGEIELYDGEEVAMRPRREAVSSPRDA
ncbi:hypothetical protein ACUSIJ_00875 [Pseudochelatococcus sp. B33]